MAEALATFLGVYTDESDSEADFDQIKQLGESLSSDVAFDAALVRKKSDGGVHIVHTLETPTRHAALEGAGIGLATGLVAALFPAIALTGGLVAGTTVGGSVLGAITGHVTDGMPRGDLKDLGDELDAGENAIVVIAAADLEDSVRQSMPKAKKVSKKDLKDPGDVDVSNEAKADKEKSNA